MIKNHNLERFMEVLVMNTIHLCSTIRIRPVCKKTDISIAIFRSVGNQIVDAHLKVLQQYKIKFLGV